MHLSPQVFASLFIVLWASQQGASVADSCRSWGWTSCRFRCLTISTVLGELQDLSKDRLHKPVNVCPMLFSKDFWDRCTLTQKGRGFTDSAWRSEVIRNLKLVNTTCSFGFKRHVVRLKDSKRLHLHLPLFKCESYCTSSTCNVQFKKHIKEDFQGKVSFQGKMPVKLITTCRLRLFVVRTQINLLKRAFIFLAESRIKCLIHLIVNLRKMAILDPSMFWHSGSQFFWSHSLSRQSSLLFNLVCMLQVQILKPSWCGYLSTYNGNSRNSPFQTV